jgi:hypothetical protein
MTAPELSEGSPTYAVAWDVFDGTMWHPVGVTEVHSEAAAEGWAEQARFHQVARTRNVEIVREQVAA